MACWFSLTIHKPLGLLLFRHLPPEFPDLPHVVRLLAVRLTDLELSRHRLDKHLVRRRPRDVLVSHEGTGSRDLGALFSVIPPLRFLLIGHRAPHFSNPLHVIPLLHFCRVHLEPRVHGANKQIVGRQSSMSPRDGAVSSERISRVLMNVPHSPRLHLKHLGICGIVSISVLLRHLPPHLADLPHVVCLFRIRIPRLEIGRHGSHEHLV
mmetsp:Transcript_2084/g.6352  ORF Transcript_2084/g.6352 Transcript_2084/m.6352 type:complete len:209 (-) Transcript_2084:387-1013(-)